MKLKFIKKHKKLFFFFMLGIGFILSICIIFSVLLKSFEKIVYDSLSDLNHDFAVQTDALTEIMNSSMADYAMQLFYSPPIQTLRSKNPISESQSKDKLRDLDNILNSSDFIESIIVHNGYTNTIYSSGADLPVQSLEKYDNHALQTLIVNKNEEPVLTPIYCRSIDSSKDGYYAFLYFTRRDSGSPAPSTLILTINASWYEKNISLFANYATKLVVFNEFGDVLMASDSELKKQCQDMYTLTANNNSGYFKSTDDNICMYHKSTATGYTYMRMVKLKELLPRLYTFRNTMFIITLVLISIFIIIFIVLLIKTWFPLNNMRNVINTIGTILDTPNASPIKDQTLLITKDQQLESVESVMFKVERVQLEHLFYDMLMNKITPDSASLFAKDNHCYGLFLISALHRKDIYQIVANQNLPLIVCKVGSACACIGVFNCNEVYEQLLTQLHTSLSKEIFYSPLFSDFNSITNHFTNLSELQKLKITFTKNWKISENILFERCDVNPFKSKDYTDFITKLKNGNLDVCLAKWDVFLKQLLLCRYELFQHMLLTISELVDKLILEMNLSDSTSIIHIPTQIEQIATIDELQTIMEKNITFICEYFSKQRITKYSLQAADIKKVIEEHYHDTNLSSQNIADLFQMNNAYLGRIFKSSCGCSINEYINQCRLNECIYLLQTSDTPIEEIAEKAGFYNIKYFYVLFKKKIGMTPASYRLTNLTLVK